LLKGVYAVIAKKKICDYVKIKERNTNYGTIFSLWDRILGTLLTSVDQVEIRMVVGAYQRPDKLNFHQLLVMPFTKPVR
jgi:sterol desaturase/sphingolipid hydroxylase (fatty acid hydroxylase superfamily)